MREVGCVVRRVDVAAAELAGTMGFGSVSKLPEQRGGLGFEVGGRPAPARTPTVGNGGRRGGTLILAGADHNQQDGLRTGRVPFGEMSMTSVLEKIPDK
jgi:hypothetical protein